MNQLKMDFFFQISNRKFPRNVLISTLLHMFEMLKKNYGEYSAFKRALH